jgi:hypothetical protein
MAQGMEQIIWNASEPLRNATGEKKPGAYGAGLDCGTSLNLSKRGHMWSIMTWPKPEQLTWVAPSIRRAKS